MNVTSFSLFFLIIAISFLFFAPIMFALPKLKDSDVDHSKTTKSAELDNDFETGILEPWYEDSLGYVKWGIEDIATPSEVNLAVPAPSEGTKYLRIKRNVNLTAGLAVLRSPIFLAYPGDRISFDFWIQSNRSEGSTLDVFFL